MPKASPAEHPTQSPTPTNYVFIDYENVSADGLDLLDPARFHAIIFCGEHQKTLPITVTEAQSRGLRVDIIRIEGRAREALDLHIAFYLGRLVSTADNTQHYFLHIISRDKGFDPLIRHLISRDYIATRAHSVMELPLIRNKVARTLADRLPIAIERLKVMGTHRPARLKTLTGTIRSLFPSETRPADIDAIILSLQSRKLIKLDGQKVLYLPALS